MKFQSGNRCDQRQAGQSSSLAPKAKKPFCNKRKDSMPKFLQGTCTYPSCKFWHFPCVSITSLNQDAHVARNVDSDTLRLMGSPAKSRRKVV